MHCKLHNYSASEDSGEEDWEEVHAGIKPPAIVFLRDYLRLFTKTETSPIKRK